MHGNTTNTETNGNETNNNETNGTQQAAGATGPQAEAGATANKPATKSKRAAKPKVEAVKRRGRPPVYSTAQKAHIASLVRKTGSATKAAEIINADETSKDEAVLALVALRSPKLFPKAMKLSMPTVLTIAKEAKIDLKPGRPSAKKTRKPAAAKSAA